MERRRRRPEREYRERRYPEQRYPERRYPERRYPEERAPRRRKTTVGDVLRMLLMIAALCVFCFSAYQLYGFYQEYKAGTDEYSGLENEYAAGEETEDLAALEEAQTVSGQEMVTVVENGREVFTSGDEQSRELRGIVRGESGYCGLDSHPGSGSLLSGGAGRGQRLLPPYHL